MGIFDKWRSQPEQTKQAYDVNSPALLELIRSGQTGSTSVSVEQAARISAVYACVKVLAESISTLPCKLYRVDGDSRTEQPEHKLYGLVNRSPNSFMTATEFWSWAVTNVALHGNIYVWLVRTASGTVVEMLPLPHGSVSVHVQAQNQVTYIVTVGEQGSEKIYTVQPEDMLHFKGMTLDGINGISPIQYNAGMLAGARDAMSYSNAVFSNGAAPRGILTTEGVLSDEAYERIAQSWKASHGGVNNAGGVAILEAGLDFKAVSMSPADIDLLSQRKYSRSEIAGMFRVPPHMIGDLEKATYSNIAEQSLGFYRDALQPWVVAMENRLNHTLLKTSAQVFRFDTSDFLRGDLKTEVESYKSLLEIGVLSPNEVRQRMGLNPREGGDEYVSQSNNLTFGDEPAPEQPEQEEPQQEEPQDPAQPEEQQQDEE